MSEIEFNHRGLVTREQYEKLEAENADLKANIATMTAINDANGVEMIKLRTLAEKMAGALKSIPVYHTTDCGCVLQTGPCDCYGKIKKQALAEWEAYESTGKC